MRSVKPWTYHREGLTIESAKLRALRAYMPTCLAYLRVHVPTCVACLRAHVPMCLACLRVLPAYMPCVLTCQRARFDITIFSFAAIVAEVVHTVGKV